MLKNEVKNNVSALKNNNTSILLLEDNQKCQFLLEQANNHIESMKKGEYFYKVINDKGKTVQHLLILSPDETYLTIIYKRCCKRTYIIFLDKISSCEIGHSNNFYSKKKFENYFTIELTNNKYYEFYHPTENNSKKWVNSINFLLQKKNKELFCPLNEIKLTKIIISNIWQKEVIPNWPTYRKYFHNKNKENYFTRKKKSNMNYIDKKKGLNDNIEILQSNKEEVLNLWTLGLPPWLRKNLWNIVIGNELEITENLFQGYIKTIFREDIRKDNNSNNHINNNRISKSTFTSSLISTTSDIKNNLIKDINNDIELFYKKNENMIKEEKKINFKEEIYIIVRSFCFFRMDVLYTKEITELASFIYLNTDNYYNAFRIFCNLIIPSYLFNIIQNDIESIKNYWEFFELLMQKYIPFLYNYFQNLNFPINNLFYKWIKNLFLKAFNYNICLIIFDNFIIRGKIFIFQVALAILMIKQKELINFDFRTLILTLKKNQLNIEEDLLFSEIEKLDIREEYKEYFELYNLGKEKIELFQDL